jgi:replicative DNA helicase
VRRINENSNDDDVVAEAEKVLAAIAERASVAQDVAIGDVMREAWAEIQSRLGRKESAGMATGFIDLDKLIVGIQPTELVIVAARPAVGKSAFAGCLIHRWAKRGISSLLLSLEMSKFEFAERLLCAESGVNASKLKAGDCLDEMEIDSLLLASGEIARLPIRIDEQGRQRVSAIAAIARRAHRVHGIEAIVIDYLQLIEPDQRSNVREQEVAGITKSLKALAKELKIPVIVLAQLNRAVENREDKRPRLADLRESGAIEQDANQVWFLHRPAAYDPADRPGECDVLVSKNRGGATGCVTLAWRAETTEFKDFASHEYEIASRASRAFQPPDWVK